ncbi:hypothetical protein P3T76_001922 [Phytophthora citrophthora]|uniref:Uncharacterized protein n=1 Tax=Phytophthora citrophthora TaxID=4793 RepID=A0AAD9GXE9_9STRA|nr:hypothetical protein P3T76_001922 [Phytophthora citrophthora]
MGWNEALNPVTDFFCFRLAPSVSTGARGGSARRRSHDSESLVPACIAYPGARQALSDGILARPTSRRRLADLSLDHQARSGTFVSIAGVAVGYRAGSIFKAQVHKTDPD